MIIVKLMGGLGNQMFQYAAGRRLARLYGTVLKLDMSFLESDQFGNTPRHFELHNLNICAEKASRREVAMMTGHGDKLLKSIVVKVFRKVGAATSAPAVYKEKHFHFDTAVLTLPDNTYLEGYWHSEKYFSDIEGIIRKEFTVKPPQTGRNLDLAGTISACNSVSVHIRRGDFAFDAATNKTHGMCDLAYYLSSAEYVAQRVDDPYFFVFSDEPDWAAANLKVPNKMTVVDNNGPDRAYEDLRLISQCRNHIIANSSFSWWGAWLCDYPGKIVVAPKRWFKDKSHNTEDVIPASWMRLF